MVATKNRNQKTTLNATELFNIIDQNKSLLNSCTVKRIGLFGSYVRNEQTSKSDVDILVEFNQATFDNFMTLAFSLEKLFHRKVDLIMPESLSPHILPFVEKEVKWHEV